MSGSPERTTEERQKTREYNRKYYAAHADHLRAYAREYAKGHKEERSAYNKRWQGENKERVKIRVHENYVLHREERTRKQREYRLDHLEEVSAKVKNYHHAHRSELTVYELNRRDSLKKSAFDKLGGKCACYLKECWHEPGKCGIADYRILQVNHINGGGNKEVKSGGGTTLYRQIIAGKRNDIELNCANCNWMHRWANGLYMKRRNS